MTAHDETKEELRQANAAIDDLLREKEQLETALRDVSAWLSQMEGRTVTAADLAAILPAVEAALDGGTA